MWLDGAYLGDPRATSSRTASTSPRSPASGDEHVLAVEVTLRAATRQRGPKRNITGVFQHWRLLDPSGTRAGCGGRCASTTTGPVRIDPLRVLCRDADEARAHLRRPRAASTATSPARVRVRTLVDGDLVAAQEQSLAARPNEVEWNLDIDSRAVVAVVARRAAADRRRRRGGRRRRARPSDARHVRTGLREVALERLDLLGQRRAAVPQGREPRPDPARRSPMRPAELRHDVELAARPGSTSCACRPTSAGPSSTTPPTSSACWSGRTSRCSGGTPRSVRRQAVRQAARRSTRSATTRRSSVVRAQRAARRCRSNRASRSTCAGQGTRRRRPAAADVEQERSSTAGSSGRSSRPTRRARSSPTAA